MIVGTQLTNGINGGDLWIRLVAAIGDV